MICDDTTDLAVINRQLFDRCLHAAQAQDFDERMNFVRRHDLFAKWAPKHRKQMAMSLRKEAISFSEAIIKQGNQTTELYFLLKFVCLKLS